MEALKIRVFGKLELCSSQKTVRSFPTRHVQELLLFLLLHPNQTNTRETLIDLLWPDCPLHKGRARLSTTLWQLGSIFQALSFTKGDFLQISRDTIVFDALIPIECDFAVFDSMMDQAKQSQLSIEQRQNLLCQACELYRGELGAGIYSEWCPVWREQFARRFLRAQEQLMALLMKQACWSRAIRLGQAILVEEPLLENIHRALMKCYVQIGQPSLAIAQYHILSKHLNVELGL